MVVSTVPGTVAASQSAGVESGRRDAFRCRGNFGCGGKFPSSFEHPIGAASGLQRSLRGRQRFRYGLAEGRVAVGKCGGILRRGVADELENLQRPGLGTFFKRNQREVGLLRGEGCDGLRGECFATQRK